METRPRSRARGVAAEPGDPAQGLGAANLLLPREPNRFRGDPSSASPLATTAGANRRHLFGKRRGGHRRAVSTCRATEGWSRATRWANPASNTYDRFLRGQPGPNASRWTRWAAEPASLRQRARVGGRQRPAATTPTSNPGRRRRRLVAGWRLRRDERRQRRDPGDGLGSHLDPKTSPGPITNSAQEAGRASNTHWPTRPVPPRASIRRARSSSQSRPSAARVGPIAPGDIERRRRRHGPGRRHQFKNAQHVSARST